ncbi:hypothetical protein COO60DRAFT_1634921 [Scenedesmus sp. NREL 46B-D3]|nr:hypothetical protein COO60DRAFT_1634921 [Scenedesmus sp. NREL 46B-D3]
MTQLTRLDLSQVNSDEGLRHLPASLLELYCDLPRAAYIKICGWGTSQGAPHVSLTACASPNVLAVTKLEFDEWDTLASHHVLPPNTQELTVGSMIGTDCLLPLTQLRELTMLGNEFSVTPAAELRQLSSLTALTLVDLTYAAAGQSIGAAAGGWGVLQLRSLDITPYRVNGSRCRHAAGAVEAHRPVVAQAVTAGAAAAPTAAAAAARAAAAWREASAEEESSLSEESSSSEEEDEPSAEDGEDGAAAPAAALSPLAVMLHSLAGCMRDMKLKVLTIIDQHVDRAAAAALARCRGLEELQLNHCQLEDCSVIDIALGLPSLQALGVPGSRGVTDACLPVLGLLGKLTSLNLCGTRVTRQGQQQYLPAGLRGKW